MLASSLLLIALLCAALLIKAPYSEMSPGPTYNTLGSQNGKPVIVINGQKTYPTSGNLNMTTVEVTSADYELNLVEAISGWLKSDADVIPHNNLYPDNQTESQAQQQNAEEFSASQDSAKAAALTQLGYKVGNEPIVAAVVEGGPSVGKLHAGDVILAVDGTKVTDENQIAPLVTRHAPGQDVVFTIVPPGKTDADRQQITITTVKNPATGKALVGITPGSEHTFPFSIDINLGDVGGPSAGLMFSLGIVDKLQSTDLTGGRFVAGTGTIDDTGRVGPIGGITMKLIAARDAGAQYFFTPADNCAQAAAATPSGLRLVKVNSLSDALAALGDIRSGATAALPACTR
jgi:PDZ domain-containing protein